MWPFLLNPNTQMTRKKIIMITRKKTDISRDDLRGNPSVRASPPTWRTLVAVLVSFLLALLVLGYYGTRFQSEGLERNKQQHSSIWPEPTPYPWIDPTLIPEA